MTKKDKKEYEAIGTIEKRAAWLLEKGVNAEIVGFPDKDMKFAWTATAAGVLLPGEYKDKVAAIAGGTAWLAEKAGVKSANDLKLSDA